MSKISISDVINNPENLNHDDCWSFYDWFCNNSSLERRAKQIIPKLKFLVAQDILDAKNTYVWLKNNCPMNGSLYDDFRISAINDDETFLGGFCPKTGINNVENKCEVWYFEGSERNIIQLEFVNWMAFKKELKTNIELRNKLIEAFKVKIK